jgi:NAD(P)-dependent dehydrogenase (short-subunit alcohol dehydrogenase family)
MTSKAFMPALSAASGNGKIITMSSDFASVSGRPTYHLGFHGRGLSMHTFSKYLLTVARCTVDNTGGNACYRISKASVNQLTKTMSVDLAKQKSKVSCLAVHPGYVPTKMTGFYGEDDMDTCMTALVETIHRFGTVAGEDLPNGGYVRWDGKPMAY